MNLLVWRLSIGLLLCLFVAGCRAGAVLPASTPTADAAADPAGLEGTQWILSSIQGQVPLADTQVTLDFEDGKLGGTSGCNHYGASYTLDGSRLKIDTLTQTVMLCDQPAGVMEQEERYVKVLVDAAQHSAAAYRVVTGQAGRRLEITDNLGVPLLVFTEKQRFAMNPADLYTSATAWRLVSLEGQPPVSGPVLLYFLNEREYSGFAGCRHYYGAYQAEGDTIAFPSAFMLGPDCHENEALNLQESSYTDGLSRARNYHLDGDRLDLLTDQGTVLSFLAEPLEMPGLAGTSWRLLAIFGSGQDAQVPFRVPAEPLLGVEMTLAFDAERAAGSAGCNTYSAAYSTDGITIMLSAPAATRKFCAQPDGLMQQERLFLRLLEESINYRLLGDQLWLNTGNGQSLLFERKP